MDEHSRVSNQWPHHASRRLGSTKEELKAIARSWTFRALAAVEYSGSSVGRLGRWGIDLLRHLMAQVDGIVLRVWSGRVGRRQRMARVGSTFWGGWNHRNWRKHLLSPKS